MTCMRIGIEAQRIFREQKHGMERVVIELIKHLQKIDTKNEYFIFVKPGIDSKVIPSTPNFNIVEISSNTYPIWEQIQLPKYVKKYKCDILHCTSSTAPIFINIPIIITIHDIIFLEENFIKQFFNKASLLQKAGNIYRRIMVPIIIKKEKYLITISNYEKENIKDHFNLKNKTFKVVHNGVSDVFNNKVCENKNVLKKLNINNRYLLHLANKDPRKNTDRVLLAFSKYISNSKNEENLVLIGITETELIKKLKNLKIKNLFNKIIAINHVTDEELSSLYKLADIFLFPSLREGFGLPIIEAMACGVPLITSNTSAIPEIAESSALLINPLSVNEICEGIVAIQENPKLKETLIHKGLKRSKEFSWEKMTSKIHELYEEVYTDITQKK
jgi:glycosyltransferase involved in cell wall biosynthesis